MSASATSLRAIMVCGAAASGKTSVGHGLSRAIGWPLLDLDEVAPPAATLVGEASGLLVHRERMDASPTRSAADRRRYDALLAEARRTLAQGGEVKAATLPPFLRTGIVLVAPFTLERMLPHAFEAAIASLGIVRAEAALVWVDTPASVTAQRMRWRAADRDAARIRAERAGGPLTSTPPAQEGIPLTPHLRSDGLLPVTRQVALLIQALQDR
ncbi:AAA family ATPase [Lysinibacter cavernae]|uniref:Putative kinase n=1 Tax=Lysinibacter cavernae TaxID=1640652 RepID=A0A7X5R3U3_9MICO|nr:AAA family ATPase [Lysinibacter cavernae]NIH55138.1 putative kinase [Lysinibacter cavernae]